MAYFKHSREWPALHTSINSKAPGAETFEGVGFGFTENLIPALDEN
jgi:hypothetical protein